MKQIEIDGVPYPSISAAAKATGISTSTISSRLRRGKAPDKRSEYRKPIPVTANGVTYPSRCAAAKATGVSAPTIQRRMERGLPIDRYAGKGVVIDGVWFGSREKAAKSMGISVSNVDKLVRGEPIRQGIVYKGREYKTMADAAREHGISRQRVHQCVSKGLHNSYRMEEKRAGQGGLPKSEHPSRHNHATRHHPRPQAQPSAPAPTAIAPKSPRLHYIQPRPRRPFSLVDSQPSLGGISSPSRTASVSPAAAATASSSAPSPTASASPATPSSSTTPQPPAASPSPSAALPFFPRLAAFLRPLIPGASNPARK